MFHRAVGRGRGSNASPRMSAGIIENSRLPDLEDAPGVEHDESWSDLVEVIENAIDSLGCAQIGRGKPPADTKESCCAQPRYGSRIG